MNYDVYTEINNVEVTKANTQRRRHKKRVENNKIQR